MRTEEIFVPYVGQTLNYFLGRKWKYKDEKNQAQKMALAAQLQTIPPFDKPVVLDFIPQLGPRRRVLDCTNYAMTAKILEDIIVSCGLLKDDSNKYVQKVGLCMPERVDTKEEEGMKIVVTEA